MIKPHIYIALAAAVVAASFVTKDEERSTIALAMEGRTEPPHVETASVSPATAPDPSSIISNDPELREVDRKYGTLLQMLSPTSEEQVKRILVARETIDQANLDQVADAERELSMHLTQEQYALYEQLREAQPELAYLDRFSQQLADAFPLTEQQQRELLIAKLDSKYEMQALELSTDRTDLPDMERGYAHDIATQGLNYYSSKFLDEARSVLADDQLLALEQFERAVLAERLDSPD